MKHDRAMAWTHGKIRVLIYAGPDSVGDWMASVVSAQPDMAFVGLVRDLTQPPDYLEKLAPDVILLDISSGILRMGDLIASLNAPTLGAAIILVAMPDELETVRRAMLSGAQGFLLKPFSETEMLQSLRQAAELVAQRRVQMAEAPRLAAGQESPPKPQTITIAVYSPKGGVGCTAVAVNLAVALKAVSKQQVTLMDGDLRFGDIDTALNIMAGPSMATLLAKLEDIDDLFLEQSLITHPSGVRVMVAPPYLDMADNIGPEQVQQIVSHLAGVTKGYLVVDTWSTLDEVTLSILDQCDWLLLVTTSQMTALRDTHRFLEALSLLHYDPEKILLVLNHAYEATNVKRADVERVLGHPVFREIAHAPFPVSTSLNRGVPLVQEYPDSPAAKDIAALARELEGLRLGSQVPNGAPATTPKADQPAKKSRLFSWSQPRTVKG